MRWIVRSDEPLYVDEWLNIRLADVELPDGKHLSHRIIKTPPSAGSVIVDDEGRALLLWRHRFITDTWGWEVPMGKIEPDETPIQAAARETEEETGWRPNALKPLLANEPSNGLIESFHHVFIAQGGELIGAENAEFESESVQWVPIRDTADLIDRKEIVSATTMCVMLYLLARGYGQ